MDGADDPMAAVVEAVSYDVGIPETAVSEMASGGTGLSPRSGSGDGGDLSQSGFAGPMVTVVDYPFWYYVMCQGGRFSFDAILVSPMMRGIGKLAGFDLYRRVPQRDLSSSSRMAIVSHKSYAEVLFDADDLSPAYSDAGGEQGGAGVEVDKRSGSLYEISLVGVYNGEPVYLMPKLKLPGGRDAGIYLFKSVKRKRFVLSSSLYEPYAMAFAEFEGEETVPKVTIAGDGWYETADENERFAGSSGFSEPSYLRFYPAGSFIARGSDGEMRLTNVAMVRPAFAGWVRKLLSGGCFEVRKYGPVSHLFKTEKGLNIGVWTWVLKDENGNTKMKVALSPYSPGLEKYYPNSKECRVPEDASPGEAEAFERMRKENLKKPPAFRTQVFFPTGRSVDCRDPCGNPVTEWVVARNKCGAWVVNLRSTTRRPFKHRVQEEKDLHAEYIFGYGGSDETKASLSTSSGRKKCMEDNGIEIPEDGKLVPDDIVFKWVSYEDEDPFLPVSMPGYVNDNYGGMALVFK